MKSAKVIRIFEKKFNSPADDLRIEERPGLDHHMYRIFFGTIFVGHFKVSRGSHEFGKKAIGLMARNLGITSFEFKEMIECRFWGKDFLKNSRLLKK